MVEKKSGGFYLIRISFGIMLASLALIFLTIFIIITATNRDGDDRGSNSSSGGMVFMPHSGSVLIGFGLSKL